MTIVIPLAAWAVLLLAVVRAWVWTNRKSPAFAAWFAFGLLARVVVGLGLFSISFWHLPILRSLQLGGGFWTLALDGRTYYEMAAHAAQTSVITVDDAFPSPVYIRVLAEWLRIFGQTPLSAVLFNLACYVFSVILILHSAEREDGTVDSLSAAAALVGLSLCPSVVLFGAQPMKDSVCVMLIVLAMAGTRMWVLALQERTSRPSRRGLLGTACLAVAVLAFAGIRAYFALFIVASIVPAALASTALASGWLRRLRAVASYSVLIPLLWVMFVIGAGAYYEYYSALLPRMLRSPIASVGALDTARHFFVTTGGSTSMISSSNLDNLPGLSVSLDRRSGPGFWGRTAQTIQGCAAILIPITVLHWLSIVSFSGGRGLLFITDLDTIVMDVAVLASLAVLFMRARRGWRQSGAVVAFAVGLAVITALPMAYVVVNYGTLFRLRVLAIAPLWVLPAFVIDRQRTPQRARA